ncbi:MAG: hypothetical protein ACOC0C_07380 [Bacteroidota bacterium]
MNETVINTAIIVTYVLVALAVFFALVGPLVQLFTNFKKAKAALIGIVVLVVVLLVGYSISTNEIYETPNYVGPTASQWIGAGIRATMILIGLGLVAAVYTEVSKLFR